jgi:1,2-diacylglycerol 3-alpha-glucosyltransferase
MKILHVCLSCFYIDNAGYQENLLVRQHVNDGHNVLVIASTETFDENGGLSYVKPNNYLGSDGAYVIRIPYVVWLPHSLARKLRVHSGVYSQITDFAPDVILFHGCSGNEIVTVAKYAKNNPDVLFYADSHEDFNNSAKGFLSRHILHRLFYRQRFLIALPSIRKILCVSTESIEFMRVLYDVPEDKIDFYPLGGFVLTDEDRVLRRKITRKKFDWGDEILVFLQSGKFTYRKKLVESLRAFKNLPGDHLRFSIVGLLTAEVRSEVEAFIENDPRIKFLGWKSSEELTDLLCAVDVYLQPGSQSATMQHSLCCGCPVIIDDVPAHHAYIDAEVTLINSKLSLQAAMAEALEWQFEKKVASALSFALKYLDYKVLADRVLHK